MQKRQYIDTPKLRIITPQMMSNHDNYRWEGYKQWREDQWTIQQIIHSTLTDLTLYDVMTGCHRNDKHCNCHIHIVNNNDNNNVVPLR